MSDEKSRLKVAFVGNSGVGKTTLINRRIYGKFDYSVMPTVGSSHLTAIEKIGDETVELCLWDTAGQEKYQSLVPLYIRDAVCVIIVASITDHLSLQSIGDWYDRVKEKEPDTVVFVVINKIDIKGENLPSIEELRTTYSNQYNDLYFVSAKDGDFVNELFYTIAMKGYQHVLEKGEAITNSEPTPVQSKRGCC